jgi:hypothetical protein
VAFVASGRLLEAFLRQNQLCGGCKTLMINLLLLTVRTGASYDPEGRDDSSRFYWGVQEAIQEAITVGDRQPQSDPMQRSGPS